MRLLIDEFNEACSNITTSYLKVGDESMSVMDESISVMRFYTTLKGKVPYLTYIFYKPEPIGTEFKAVA